MRRRHFLLGALAAPVALRAQTEKIERITLAPIEGRFHKFVAMNAYDTAPKGHTYANVLVRVRTNRGTEGVGVMGYRNPDADFLAALKTLIGVSPLALYEWADGRLMGRAVAYREVLERYRHLDGPLLDLAGKVRSKPVWALFGDAVRDRVEAYDGTLYFSDIWFADRGVAAVVEEAEEACKKGYTGVKLKAGRGWKWMDAAAGVRRDIDVIRAVRRAVGPDVRVMVDPNNGYERDHDGLWRLLAETAEANVYWIEEPFPESVAGYAELRDRIDKARLKTRIADGENMQALSDLAPYLKPRRLIDVMQLDIRTAGLVDNFAVAREGEGVGSASVPHNWGAQMGLIMAVQLAAAAKNVPFVEDDRSTCDAIIAEGYEFRGGRYRVPGGAGFSIRVSDSVYRKKYQERETVVS